MQEAQNSSKGKVEGPAIITGMIIEAGWIAPETEGGYNRLNISVADYQQMQKYPRNLFHLKVVVIAEDDFKAIMQDLERSRENS